MQPLDLRFRPPRGPRETLNGLCFLPRTVDKIRAEMPGGFLGPYLNETRGVSYYMCRRVGIDMDELRSMVAESADEDDLARRLHDRLDPGVVEETNRKLEGLTIERLSPADLEMVRERHPVLEARPDLVRFFDIFEADDRATYPG